MVQESRSMFWIMLICLVGISGMAIYKFVTKGDPPYISFSIVAALSGAMLKQLPLFLKFKYLNTIPALAALILLAVGIFTEIKPNP